MLKVSHFWQNKEKQREIDDESYNFICFEFKIRVIIPRMTTLIIGVLF